MIRDLEMIFRLLVNDLRKAMDALIKGKSIDENQRPSLGCNIKWKK